VEDCASLRTSPPLLLLLLNVDGERYYVPLCATASARDEPRHQVAQCGRQTVCDAHGDPDFGRALLSLIASGGTVEGTRGCFIGRSVHPWSGPPPAEALAMPVRTLGGEQSNTSLLFDRALILKSFRRPQDSVNPEVEITHFLTSRTQFA